MQRLERASARLALALALTVHGPAATVLDSDHKFDTGSRIVISDLSDNQVRNLATLARVWGFLKHHHRAVVAGTRHWDYDLFRVMPRVLAAPDAAAANDVMADWTDALGAVPACDNCVTLPAANLAVAPRLDWIADEAVLGPRLSLALRGIHRNRGRVDWKFYVSLQPGRSRQPRRLLLGPESGMARGRCNLVHSPPLHLAARS